MKTGAQFEKRDVQERDFWHENGAENDAKTDVKTDTKNTREKKPERDWSGHENGHEKHGTRRAAGAFFSLRAEKIVCEMKTLFANREHALSVKCTCIVNSVFRS